VKLTGATAIAIENAIGEVTVNVTTTTAPVTEYTAGEDLPAKSVVCVGETAGKLYLTKADDWTTMPAIGISNIATETGETVAIYQTGKVANARREANFSPDDKIFVSPDTAGKVTKTPPEGVGKIVQSLGRAINESDIILEIDHTVLELEEV
ncbi:unnamed protein product, partial [marine sediment metagenome]